MAQKPPAFQFYVKDWLTSPTVRKMTPHHRGIYIDLLAAAWNSDEPGTLPLPLDFAARSAGLDIRILRDFMAKSPRCFREIGTKLVNEKLHEQWLSYKELSVKRSNAAKSRYAASAQLLHEQNGRSAFASASATAIKEEPKTIGQPTTLTDFDVFWDSYPRKIHKPEARKAFTRAGINGHLGSVIAGLESWKHCDQWADPQYIPHPARFINQKQWNDSPVQSQSPEERRAKDNAANIHRVAGEFSARVGSTPRSKAN